MGLHDDGLLVREKKTAEFEKLFLVTVYNNTAMRREASEETLE